MKIFCNFAAYWGIKIFSTFGNQTHHDTEPADAFQPALRRTGRRDGAGLRRSDRRILSDGRSGRLRFSGRIRGAAAGAELAHRPAARFAGRRRDLRLHPCGDPFRALRPCGRGAVDGRCRVAGLPGLLFHGLRGVAAGEVQHRRYAAHGVLRPAVARRGALLRFAGAGGRTLLRAGSARRGAGRGAGRRAADAGAGAHVRTEVPRLRLAGQRAALFVPAAERGAHRRAAALRDPGHRGGLCARFDRPLAAPAPAERGPMRSFEKF